MAKKYLTKNEFRKYKNPNYKSKSGEAHPAYISVKRNKRVKFNVITHSPLFFNEPTIPLDENPDRNKSDKRKSRVSIPHWENEKKLFARKT